MRNILLLGSLSLVTMWIGATPAAWGAQAAPTRPVYSKNLNAPDVAPSDTKKLEAIVDNDTIGAATASPARATGPAPAPQTILVMPSAATPAPVAALTIQAAPREERREIAPKIPTVEAGFQDSGSGAAAWHQWIYEPTSVFTAFIAFFTFLLALTGAYHVYRAAATARRQLRAYVFITNTEINGVAAQAQPVAQLAIRNTGQTPAHEVVVYGSMLFDEFPLTKDLPVLVFSDPQLTKENIGPGNERYKWEYALLPLTPEQVNKLNAGTHAVYVYGEIRYRDVFRKKCSTKYLYYTGGTMGVRGNILGGYPEGNEAV